MNVFDSLKIALTNLGANKLRSILTMLGIIIGVSAVIMMVAILQGFSARFQKQLSKLGSDLIIVVYAPTSKERKKITNHIDGLKMTDIRAIQERCTLIKSWSPEMPVGNGVTAKYIGRDTDCSPTGVVPDYQNIRNVKVATGRFISEADMKNWSPICVIGDKIREQLFYDTDPIGKLLEVNGQSMTVVGVLEHKGRTFEGDADKSVYLPLTSVQKRMIGSETVGVVYCQPKNPLKMDEAKDQIWQVLMTRYDNLPGWKVDGFDSLSNTVTTFLAAFTLVLGSIAGLALLVGGIGVMNIMLVSVTERTREIGVRKAIGAKRRDILVQFLVESATLSGAGGLLGIIIGTSAAYFVGFITTFIPALVDKQAGEKGLTIFVPPFVIIGSFLFSAGIGIFFGVYPAIRASRLDPIQALRTE